MFDFQPLLTTCGKQSAFKLASVTLQSAINRLSEVIWRILAIIFSKFMIPNPFFVKKYLYATDPMMFVSFAQINVFELLTFSNSADPNAFSQFNSSLDAPNKSGSFSGSGVGDGKTFTRTILTVGSGCGVFTLACFSSIFSSWFCCL